jgi:2-desacetyl-2-hydroxyethyl bacteriochlorophyllide A dehydrogenase
MISRTIVFDEANQATLTEQPLAAPPPGHLTVAATVSLISTGTELICYHGACDADTHWAAYAKYPHYPGYSLVGRVAKIGQGVYGFEPGQRVAVTASHRSHVNLTPAQVWGQRIPDDISDEEAAWASLAVITQTGVRMAEHVMGDGAVVIGLGPLGQLVVQYLRLLGCQHVIAIDPVQARLDRALAHGATAAFCGMADAAKEFVLAECDGRLADVVYDVTGHWAVLPTALPLARDHGKLILLGDSPHPSKQHLTYDVLSRQVQIIGSRSSWLPPQYVAWAPQRMTDLFFTYLESGQMRVRDLITHRYDPRQAEEVYQALSAKRTDTMGVVFEWNGASG